MVVRDRYTGEKMIISEHALRRAKRRLCFGGNSLVRFARKAFNEGIGFREATGKLAKYIKREYKYFHVANNIRIYGHVVYFFKNNVLLTVLELPQPLWECWDNRKRSRRSKF